MKLWLKMKKEIMRYSERNNFCYITSFEIADELLLTQNEYRPPNLRKVIGPTFDSVTLMGRTHKQISTEYKERLKLV